MIGPLSSEQLPRRHTLDGVPDAVVSRHPISTDDGLRLGLLRFHRATGPPVLLVHGLTTSTDMFVLPEHRNLVTCLLDEGYDVWSLDTRMSNRHSYNLRPHRWTLDDCALFDYPPALAEVRRHTGDGPLHVISHCLGAATFSMSLAAGVVTGIAGLVANSVSLVPRVPRWTRCKLVIAPPLLALARIPYLDPGWGDAARFSRGRLISRAVSAVHRECDVPACHLLSMMWGTGWPALYQHDNMDERTHRRAADLYGPTSLHYHRHILAMARAGRAVKYRPGDPALRDTAHRDLPDDYLAAAAGLDTPILLTTGQHNRVFTDSNQVCHQRLVELGATGAELVEFPGYGHQDVFMGKDIARDIAPTLLDFLRRTGAAAPPPLAHSA